MSFSSSSPPPERDLAAEGWTPAPKEDPAACLPEANLTSGEMKWPSEWHLVAYLAAHGHSQREIARQLNYTESWLSQIINKPEVQSRIERIRKDESANLDRRFAEIAPVAFDFMADVVSGRESSRTGERLEAAKWMLEKKTGKPRTEGSEEQGNVALQILQSLQQLNAARAAAAGGAERPDSGERDITPQVESAAERWVRENLNQVAREAKKEGK